MRLKKKKKLKKLLETIYWLNKSINYNEALAKKCHIELFNTLPKGKLWDNLMNGYYDITDKHVAEEIIYKLYDENLKENKNEKQYYDKT